MEMPSRATLASRGEASGPRRPIPAIPGYEILGELGRGGMGVVYKARQIRLNRPCVFKMILAGAHATPEAVARFLGEAEAIARLQHRHIVEIHSIGEAEGLPYFELEYLPGGGLEKRLDGTPWVPKRRLDWSRSWPGRSPRPTAGIVHRDLKPPNILGLRRHAQDHRFRPGQVHRQRLGPDREQRDHGLAQLHVARAGRGLHQAGRTGRRPLRAGRDPLRTFDGPAAVPGRYLPETIEQVKAIDPVPPITTGAEAAARHRDHPPEMPREGP